MRVKSILLACVAMIVALAANALASPFVNLDFEQSTVLKTDGTVVSTSAAFPGWTAQFGGVDSDEVYHDYSGGGEPIVALFDQTVTQHNYILLQGKYMAYLFTGTSNEVVSLDQVGDIPSGIMSLTMMCDGSNDLPLLLSTGRSFQWFTSAVFAGRDSLIFTAETLVHSREAPLI